MTTKYCNLNTGPDCVNCEHKEKWDSLDKLLTNIVTDIKTKPEASKRKCFIIKLFIENKKQDIE